MLSQQDRLTEVVDAILRYLDSHPYAADTSEGIAIWWVPPEYLADRDTVLSALARLESQGLVRRRINADRHVVYSRQEASGQPSRRRKPSCPTTSPPASS